MEKLEEQRERELKAAYQAHRRLREGKAQEDDEGNFVRWIERPDRQALEKYLGIHDDNFKPAVEMASDIPEQVIIIAGKEIILNPQRQQEPIDITAQQNTEQPQIAPPVENKDNQ